MPAAASMSFLRRCSAMLAVLGAGLLPSLAAAADACPATSYFAVERKTGVCHVYPGSCRAPADAIPVKSCLGNETPLDLSGLWRVKSSATDSSKPRFSLLSVRITGQQAALVFLINDAWEAFVAPFDPATNSAQVISLDKGAYNGWHIDFLGEYSAVLKSSFCSVSQSGGVGGSFVTPSAASSNGLPWSGSGCRMPEGTTLQLEKLL